MTPAQIVSSIYADACEAGDDVPNDAFAEVLLNGFRRAILAACRDQRHACAEAVITAYEPGTRIPLSEAHSLVMNAPVPDLKPF